MKIGVFDSYVKFPEGGIMDLDGIDNALMGHPAAGIQYPLIMTNIAVESGHGNS